MAVYIAECADAWGTACQVGALHRGDVMTFAAYPPGTELSVWPCLLSNTVRQFPRPDISDLASFFSARFAPRPDIGPDFFEGDITAMKAAAREYAKTRTAVRDFYENNADTVKNLTLDDALAKFRDYASKKRWRIPPLDRPAFAAIIAGWDDTALVLRPSVSDFIRRHVRPKADAIFTLTDAEVLFKSKGYHLDPISALKSLLENRLDTKCHKVNEANVFIGFELVE